MRSDIVQFSKSFQFIIVDGFNRQIAGWMFLLVLLSISSCANDDNDPSNNTPPAFEISVDLNSTHQTIDGFGAANRMWGQAHFLNESISEEAFEDLALSIFRVRIPSDRGEWSLVVPSAREAQKYGVKILASPWSPPPSMKSNNNSVGGRLLEEHYEAFAEYINEYVEYMAANDIAIYAISIQNEPDIEVSYESCDWSPIEMANFIKDYAHLIKNTKISAPESFNFNQNFSNVLLNDPEVEGKLDIVAGHIYGSGLDPYPLAEEKGKPIWMTEYLLNLGTGNTGAPAWDTYSDIEIWEETLEMLRTIHLSMTYNWNAYIWWYLKRYYSFIGDGDFANAPNGEILKRGYAFSQYSKFVRPGYIRVDAGSVSSSTLEVTAYKGDDRVVVVLLNREMDLIQNVQFTLSGVDGIASATSYVTSPNFDREMTELEMTEEGAPILTNILPMSITTVVISL